MCINFTSNSHKPLEMFIMETSRHPSSIQYFCWSEKLTVAREEIPPHYVTRKELQEKKKHREKYGLRETREVEKLAYIFQFNENTQERRKTKTFRNSTRPNLESENNLISIFCLSMTISVANCEWMDVMNLTVEDELDFINMQLIKLITLDLWQ